MKNIKYISASAGSGKTYTLTKILTDVIKNKEVEPENVILTTFTRPAAAEFKVRAKAMLYENNMVVEADRLDQALIGTIHSVAEALIHKYWYILGLSPHITPISEDDEAFFKNQSLSNLVQEDELAFLNQFAEEFNIREQRSPKIIYDFWKPYLSQILEYTKNYQISDYKPSIEYSKEMTRSLVHGGYRFRVNFDVLEEILKQATIENDADDSDEQLERRVEIENHKRWMKTRDPASLSYRRIVCEFVNSLPWKSLASLKEEFFESVDQPYASENVREMLNKFIDTLFSLAERWNNRYQKYKAEHNLIDFADMEAYLYELLKNQEVADDIRATYKYVFVDEFQDCSPIQVLIFDRFSEIVEHSYWVGDKKQAIFGFRGSDSALTTSVMDIIKDNEKKGLDGCTTDILKYSWRSLPAIVNFSNAVYAKGFSSEPEEEVCLKAKRTTEGEGSVGYWWLDGTNQKTRAEALTANIIDLIKKGENPSDIAVLARYNSDLTTIAGYLREAHVPVQIEEPGHVGADTVSLVKALLQLIADENAEQPKAEIAFLTENDYKLGKLIDDKIEYNQDEKTDSLYYENIPLVKKLLAEKDRYKLMSIPALVQSLIIELDLFNVAKKLNDNVDTTKLLHKIIDAATTYEDHCSLLQLPSSILGFLTYLSENDIAVSGSTEGVQLFTCHKSKGLEWKTVILTSCDKDLLDVHTFIKFNIFGTRLVRVTNSTKEKIFPEVRIAVLPNVFFGNTNVAEEWIEPITTSQRYKDLVESSKAEIMRLMYVAMTRPRDRLIIALNNSRFKNSHPLLTFRQLGFNVAPNYKDTSCDLFGVGITSKKMDNAPLDIKYDYEEGKDLGLNIGSTSEVDVPIRDLQPSGMEGGDVQAELIDCGVPITTTGDYDSTALGTCVHDIFCVADKKSDQEVAQLVKAYGFENNLKDSGQIKKSWESLTEWLMKNYGPDKKQYHELPFKHLLPNGQIVTGSMDFVWETAEGCVVVDYKTTNTTRDTLLNKATDVYVGKYKGQIECYEQALVAAGKKVLGKYLYYPMAGVLVKM